MLNQLTVSPVTGTVNVGSAPSFFAEIFASALLKRLLVSVAIFAVGFVSVCVFLPVPEDWGMAMVGALPGVALIFIVVSVIWFVAQRVRDWHQPANEIKRRTGQ